MSESPQENTQAQSDPAPEHGSEPAAAPATGTASESVAAPPRAHRWRAGITLLLLAAAAAAFVWYWYENRARTSVMRDALTQKVAEADTKAETDRRVAEEAREALSALNDKVATLEKQVEQTRAQQAALDSVVQSLSRNRDDWTIAEAEQTLLIAAKQLQLSGDVTAALGALRSAQDKLRPLAQPGLKGLREAVDADIARLQKVPTLDATAIGKQLNDLIDRVDKLSLAMDVRPKADARGAGAVGAEEPLWKRLLLETWEELKQLVRVERMDRSDIPLLAPSQVFFLRENLKLRLLNARLALVSRDLSGYKADIGAARDWLQRYFDVRDDVVTRAIGMLSNLYAAETSAEVPDISASLEAMREFQRARPPAAAKP